jgi:predicted site-specific integrase-resolvase
MPVEMLTGPEAQRYLRVSRWTIARMARKGLLEGAVKINGEWRVPVATVEALQQGEQPGREERD